MPIEIPSQTRDDLIGSIKRFARETLDDDFGDLKATLLLDFVLAEIAPAVYNRAIADAQAVLQERVQDLTDDCYQPDGGYWAS